MEVSILAAYAQDYRYASAFDLVSFGTQYKVLFVGSNFFWYLKHVNSNFVEKYIILKKRKIYFKCIDNVHTWF